MNERNNGSRPENGKNAVGKDRSRGFGEGSQRNERTIGEIISDATDEELRKYHTGTLTPEELKAAVEKSRRAGRRRMLRRLAAVAALLVIAVAGAFFAFENFTTNVDADKNAKEEIVTEDGVVIEDGGWGSDSEQSWEITDWDEVATNKTIVPELVIPDYIPEGYKFKKLVIHEMYNAINIEYLFFEKTRKEELILNQFINKESLESTHIYNSNSIIKTSKGKVYITKQDTINTATIQIEDDCIIEILSNLPDKEVIKMIESLEI